MSRGESSPKRVIKPDYFYGSSTIERFINVVMVDGKKSVARNIVYSAIAECNDKIVEKYGDVAKGFDEIIVAISPSVRMKSRRIGGSVYRIPTPLDVTSRISAGMKMLRDVIRGKAGISAKVKLINEIRSVMDGKSCETEKMRNRIEEEAKSSKAIASAYSKI